MLVGSVRSADPRVVASAKGLDQGPAVSAGRNHLVDADARPVHRQQLCDQVREFGADVMELPGHLPFLLTELFEKFEPGVGWPVLFGGHG
jgi:hypothetical protein